VRTADWYFDFISPYAWFGLHELRRLPPALRVTPRPLLFAGLLEHWGQKGPAEIPPKRLWTFRACVYWAETHGIDFRPPAAHPFNPLPYLRLALAAEAQPEAVERIFRALWTSGADPRDPQGFDRLAQSLGIDPAAVAAPEIKARLRANTDAAIAAGVFGVPSLVIDGEVFWGADSTDFALAYLRDPTLLQRPAMQRAAEVQAAVHRRQR
jgi:2-hydroxychromene-2-carboxylate isomerase